MDNRRQLLIAFVGVVVLVSLLIVPSVVKDEASRSSQLITSLQRLQRAVAIYAEQNGAKLPPRSAFSSSTSATVLVMQSVNDRTSFPSGYTFVVPVEIADSSIEALEGSPVAIAKNQAGVIVGRIYSDGRAELVEGEGGR